MEQSIKGSQSTTVTASQAEQTLALIESSIQDMTDKTDIIATAATEQSSVSYEITNNVQSIANASSEDCRLSTTKLH
ncbi:hypothetical protein VYA_41150 (plasmid) [Vibrio alfacsensis]|nr:hypothetical protein [Vibrio sp. 04Ya108]BBM67752.1 hypothetical protein VA249_43980 [Vibrio alfacsensis]BCN26923.1 hypothetical protein VYA_41150 [Vibrio alfacsensis]